MSTNHQEELGDVAESSISDELFQPKKTPKAVRVLTVLAYVLSVSMAAILLSLYYLFMWKAQPHIGAHQDNFPGFYQQVGGDGLNGTTTEALEIALFTEENVLLGNTEAYQSDGKPSTEIYADYDNVYHSSSTENNRNTGKHHVAG